MKPSIVHLILLIAAFSCNTSDTTGNVENATASLAIGEDATTTSPALQEVETKEPTTITMTGYIDVPPANRASISPYYGGFVEKISVLPGQRVKKGEVLLILRNPEYLEMQQAYLEGFAQLDYLKSEFERQQALEKEQISSKKVMMKAESDYRQMVARTTAIRKKIALLGLSLQQIENGNLSSAIQLKAPMNGTVTALNVTNGAFVDSKAIALELINTEHIHLELDAFEKDATLLSEGQTFEFRIPEFTSETFQGEVYLVNKSVNMEKRTVKIHGHILGEEGINLFPGMFVEANLTITDSKK